MFKNIENVLCLGLIATALIMFLVSLNFPAVYIWGVPDPNRPYQAEAGTWPRVICVVLAILCVLRMIDKKLENYTAKTDKNEERPHAANIRQTLAFTAAVGAYMALLVPIGFPIATMFFGLIMVLVLDKSAFGAAKSAAVISLISAGVIVVFCKILYLPLPRGLGVFREFSQWLIF